MTDVLSQAIERTAAPKGLRIAFVTETFAPEINGVAMTAGHFVRGLRQRGHNVQLIRPKQRHAPSSNDDPNTVLVSGLPIPNYPGLQFGLPCASTLRRLWVAQRPDIVHVVTEGPLGWSAVRAAHKLNIPVTSGFHTNFHRYTAHYGLGWMQHIVSRYLRFLHSRTKCTMVPTRALALELDRLGYRNLCVVSRGVDTQLFNPSRRDPALRAQWGVNDHGLVVLYVGRLAAEKNIRTVLNAFAAIRAYRRDARLVFVGDGPLSDRLKKQQPDAIFCGVQRAEGLAQHYASADVFLFPSLSETFGNVTSEAMASGLGIVAYHHAAAGELITHNVDGCVASPGDERAFVGMAVTLASEAGLLSSIRPAARARALSLDWDRVIYSFEHELFEAIQQQAPQSIQHDALAAAPCVAPPLAGFQRTLRSPWARRR